MLLSHKTVVKLNDDEANILGHLCYAAYKLWNVCNYERRNYHELDLEEYPDWYYQKKAHKDDLWFKSLPSQTAQEVCKQLDKGWKSYFALLKTKGIDNPNPPRFKREPMEITYMQCGIVHRKGENKVRLSLPKKLKEHMRSEYGIEDNYLYLENKIFLDTDTIKQIKMYPPEDNEAKVIVIYEVNDVMPAEENGHYLSIDLGLHNLFTCYDSEGTSFIAGRKYLNISYRYDKEIARIQSQWSAVQSSKGIKHPKTSKHLKKVYQKKQNSINDYLHKVTRMIAEYCRTNDISVVVIGDIKNIRKDRNLGHVVNQKLHSLPYSRIYGMLSYKLALYGIQMIREKESYTSQCGPFAPSVSKEYAVKKNRINRGLYKEDKDVFNADAVGAFNILRKYLAENEKEIVFPVKGISDPIVIKAAV
ncbi:MAG: transposase [Lachnospiraceae bacterium]|nr:transposase [Lachnospiraceae bacterium]